MAHTESRKLVTRQLVTRLAERERGFKRKTIRFIAYLAVFYLAYLFCAGDYGLFRINRLYRQRDALEREYRVTVAEAADLSFRLRRLQTDSHYLEWLARTRYGFSRPDETIYHIKLPAPQNGHP
ncbi:MAG: hypothetical protein GYA46_04330 [candidate division Zixibacteria bacterium]|nr:hypothetical protein [candidate division Zixibacteria bacterium]